jgi:hypothetical protein
VKAVKKIAKWLLGVVLGATGLLLLVSVLVFLPPVQDFVKRKAAAYVSQTMGVKLDVGRFRLQFPLILRIDDTLLRSSEGDTLAYVGRLRAGVAPVPLLGGSVQVRRFRAGNMMVDWADSTLTVRGHVRQLRLDNVRARPARGRVRVGAAAVSGADVELHLEPSADTTQTPPPEWNIAVRSVELDGVSFRMDSIAAQLDKGRAESVRVDLAGGATDIGRVRIEGGQGEYGTLAEVSELHLDAADIHNKGSDIALTINELTLSEKHGLRITEGRAELQMDSVQVAVSGLLLTTGNGSRLTADVRADAAALAMNPAAAFEARIGAQVAEDDVRPFFKIPADSLLHGKALAVELNAQGTLNDLTINTLSIVMMPFINFNATGNLRSVTDMANIAGNLHLNGQFADIQRFTTLPIPKLITLRGDVAAGAGSYRPSLRVTADGGHLDLEGDLSLKTQTYTARVDAADFPLVVMPGAASLTLDAEGQGFDPLSPDTRAKIDLGIQRLDYQGYSYNNASLDATLAQGHFTARARSTSGALALNLNAQGDLAHDNYAAKITGRIDTLDLARMGFSTTPLAVKGTIDASAAVAAGTYSADAVLDSVRITTAGHSLAVDRTTLMARADTSRVLSTIRSGDIYAVLNVRMGIEKFMARIAAATDTLTHQMAARNLRPAAVDSLLPPLNLNMQMGRRNAAYRYLVANKLGFGTMSLSATKSDSASLRVRALATGFHTESLMLDTLNAGIGVRRDRLNYYLRLANRPGNIEQLALIYLYGSVRGDSLTMNFNQRNRHGQTGFAFGVEARLADSTVRASLVPPEGRRRSTSRTDSLTFAYEPWGVNKGNYVQWRVGARTVDADLDLRSHEIRPGTYRQVKIQSADSLGRVMLTVNELDIAKALDLLPAPPPVTGVVGLQMALGLGGEAIDLNGSAAAHDLTWDGRRVGNLASKITTRSAAGTWTVGAEASVNDSTALSLSGTYTTGGVNFVLSLPRVPLEAVNPFIPDGVVVLGGALTGNMTVEGPLAALDIDGSLAFNGGSIKVPMVGTTFGISPQPVRIVNNRVRLRDFGLIAPNRQLLSIDGTFDIDSMECDLTLDASNFQIVNAARNIGSQVYGTAVIDADIGISGPLSGLLIEGDTKLRRPTNVIYTMMDSPLSVDDRKQHIVTFVPFTDSLAMEFQAQKQRAKPTGANLRLTVDIEDAVRATVNLSDNGNDRIELTGGGDLALSMNTQGDMRLTGRYALTGGTVVYNPPIPTVTQKNFAVAQGSYVSWTGDVMAPEFNIHASQTVRADVTEQASNLSRSVNFQISAAITGTLAAMQIAFDLAAPNDLAIQNELSSLAPEQRAQQAMALMIYNTYTGPGTTAKADTGNAVYSFIEKELNQWARNTLRGVDLSLGIRQQDDGMGGQHMDYSYKVSKNLFNDRVRVTVGGNIDNGTTTADVDVKNNLIADVSLEYRLAKWDNLFLKAYRYNTRESILEGEVVETGGGVLYRKNFERLRDLFRLSKGPERRALRREVRTEERRIWRDSVQRDSMRAVWRARRAQRDSTRIVRDTL